MGNLDVQSVEEGVVEVDLLPPIPQILLEEQENIIRENGTDEGQEDVAEFVDVGAAGPPENLPQHYPEDWLQDDSDEEFMSFLNSELIVLETLHHKNPPEVLQDLLGEDTLMNEYLEKSKNDN